MKIGYGFRAVALAVTLVAGGCARNSPTAPEQPAATAVAPDDGAALTSSAYTVALNPDRTASPATLAVASGYSVLFVNNSGVPVALHSYNCSEFTYMSLYPGYSKRTLPFSPAGKTCDYFAYDSNYQKMFVGRIIVQ
jgi:ABC-type Fe3+-hydroxamate transport system substrate-binding protein